MAEWPVNYQEQLSGIGCPTCAEGRPDEINDRIRFFSSGWSDGYLHLRGVQRGYAAVIWRGRHVAEPTELSDAEASAFWFDVLRVGRAMQAVYRPLKMNYQLLGNRIPHLHCLQRSAERLNLDETRHPSVTRLLSLSKGRAGSRRNSRNAVSTFLHFAIVAPRFVEDVAPGDPLPGAGYQDFPEVEVRREGARLREFLGQT